MAEEEEEKMYRRRVIGEKEKIEDTDEKDEKPGVDIASRDQDDASADVEKYTNLVRDYRHSLEKLDHLANTLKSSISEEDKKEVEEQIIDARNEVIAAKKRVDDYRVKFGDSAPSSEGETLDEFDHQYEIVMADTEEIAKRRKKE